MNIIEAWKKAKEGQRIEIGAARYKKHDSIGEFLSERPDNIILSNDWGVVKETKEMGITMGELRKENNKALVYTHIPNDAKVIITWEE